MEDILALIIVTLAVAIMAYVVYRVMKKNQQATAEHKARQAKLNEQLAEMKRETTRKLRADEAARVALRKHPNYGMPEFDPKNPDVLKPRETIVQQKSRFQPETVQSRREEVMTPVSNWSSDLLTTMVIADMLTNHKDVSAGTVTWKDDTPTIKETYSKPSTDFGFDDSDSRKSSSSLFSTSDSSSSWSSSSSSSDSGPSSDW